MAKKQTDQKNDDQDQFNSEDSNHSSDDASNEHGEILHIEDMPDNMEIPFQEYRKSFSIFNNRNNPSNLKSYVKIKSQLELDNFNQAISMINFGSKQQDFEQQNVKKINNQLKNPHEFFASCKVPPNTTIFIHIFRVDNKRCNIKVTNVSGYVIGYLTDIMPSRKFYKIYKLLGKIGINSLFVIFDEYESVSKDSSFIKKIADYAKNFCYFNFIIDGKIPLKFTNISLYEQKLTAIQATKKQKSTYLWLQNNVFWYFSEIFIKKQRQFNSLLAEMKYIQQKIQNAPVLNQFDEIKDSSMNFIIKSILINLSKLKKYQTTSQLIDSLKNMTQDHENLVREKTDVKFGNPLDHYPEMLKLSKQCVHCQKNKDKVTYDKLQQNQLKTKKNSNDSKEKIRNKNKQNKIDFENQDDILLNKKSKTKYRCQGCSAEAKKDIPLCLDCFEGYHKNKQLVKKKKIKKAEYLSQLRKQRKQMKIQSKNQKNNSHLQKNSQNLFNNEGILERMNEEKKQIFNEAQIKEMNVQKISNIKVNQNSCKLKIEQNENLTYFFESNEQSTDSIDDQDSQYSINTRKKVKELQQNQKYKRVLQKLDSQKKKFLKILSQMSKDKKTKKIAKVASEYVKFKVFSLLDEEKI